MVMKAGYLAAAPLVLIAGGFAWAIQKPNFGGVWIMDRARSFGMPGDMNQTLRHCALNISYSAVITERISYEEAY